MAPHKKQEHLTPEAMHHVHDVKRANAGIAELNAPSPYCGTIATAAMQHEPPQRTDGMRH
jgi:hypothetical protein